MPRTANKKATPRSRRTRLSRRTRRTKHTRRLGGLNLRSANLDDGAPFHPVWSASVGAQKGGRRRRRRWGGKASSRMLRRIGGVSINQEIPAYKKKDQKLLLLNEWTKRKEPLTKKLRNRQYANEEIHAQYENMKSEHSTELSKLESELENLQQTMCMDGKDDRKKLAQKEKDILNKQQEIDAEMIKYEKQMNMFEAANKNDEIKDETKPK